MYRRSLSQNCYGCRSFDHEGGLSVVLLSCLACGGGTVQRIWMFSWVAPFSTTVLSNRDGDVVRREKGDLAHFVWTEPFPVSLGIIEVEQHAHVLEVAVRKQRRHVLLRDAHC